MLASKWSFFGITFALFSYISLAGGDCELPSRYKVPHKTFVINKNLSCATNIFLYVVPSIAMKADEQLTAEEKKNPQAAGRLAYELMGDAFASVKPDIPVKDFTISGKDSKHDIPVRLYEGKNKDKAILFTHGGGWSRGNLKTHDTLCRKLCEATGATVLAVDYRLAPEHPHPAGLEDAEMAYNWLMANPEHGKKIFISGDSGGGNIASALAIKMIQEGKPIPDGAILIYPALDLRIPERTTDPYANGYLLTRDSINAYVHNYIGNDYEKANDPIVSPLMASNEVLAKFPPSLIINAECDPLAAEGGQFADRLSSLGVPVNRKVISKTIHIFAQYFDLFPEATEAMSFIKAAFENLGYVPSEKPKA